MPDRHTDTKISPRQSNIGRSNAKRLQNLCHVAEFFQPPWKKMLLLCKVLLMWDVSYKTTTWWISAPLARHIWHASTGSSSKKSAAKLFPESPMEVYRQGAPDGCLLPHPVKPCTMFNSSIFDLFVKTYFLNTATATKAENNLTPLAVALFEAHSPLKSLVRKYKASVLQNIYRQLEPSETFFLKFVACYCKRNVWITITIKRNLQ
jgi:hypothetical protein